MRSLSFLAGSLLCAYGAAILVCALHDVHILNEWTNEDIESLDGTELFFGVNNSDLTQALYNTYPKGFSPSVGGFKARLGYRFLHGHAGFAVSHGLGTFALGSACLLLGDTLFWVPTLTLLYCLGCSTVALFLLTRECSWVYSIGTLLALGGHAKLNSIDPPAEDTNDEPATSPTSTNNKRRNKNKQQQQQLRTRVEQPNPILAGFRLMGTLGCLLVILPGLGHAGLAIVDAFRSFDGCVFVPEGKALMQELLWRTDVNLSLAARSFAGLNKALNITMGLSEAAVGMLALALMRGRPERLRHIGVLALTVAPTVVLASISFYCFFYLRFTSLMAAAQLITVAAMGMLNPRTAAIVGGSILTILGTAHGLFTVFDLLQPDGSFLHFGPADGGYMPGLKGPLTAYPALSFWEFYMGVNLTHSLGLLLVGLLPLLFGIFHWDEINSSTRPLRWVLVLPLTYTVPMAGVAAAFFFTDPLIGVCTVHAALLFASRRTVAPGRVDKKVSPRGFGARVLLGVAALLLIGIGGLHVAVCMWDVAHTASVGDGAVVCPFPTAGEGPLCNLPIDRDVTEASLTYGIGLSPHNTILGLAAIGFSISHGVYLLSVGMVCLLCATTSWAYMTGLLGNCKWTLWTLVTLFTIPTPWVCSSYFPPEYVGLLAWPAFLVGCSFVFTPSETRVDGGAAVSGDESDNANKDE